MVLHVQTMFVMAMTAAAVLAVSLSVLAHRRHRDLVTWSQALLLQLAAMVLLSLRDKAPDFVSIVLGNALAHAGIAMFAVGLYRFDHRRVPGWVMGLPLGATLVGFALLIDDYRGRMILGGVIMLAQCLHMLALLLARRRTDPGRGQYMLLAAAVVYTAAMSDLRRARRPGHVHAPHRRHAPDRVQPSRLADQHPAAVDRRACADPGAGATAGGR